MLPLSEELISVIIMTKLCFQEVFAIQQLPSESGRLHGKDGRRYLCLQGDKAEENGAKIRKMS